MSIFKRQYSNYSRYDLDNEPSFNAYKKRFDDTQVLLEDPELIKKFHREKLRDYGLEPSSAMAHEMPRKNFWSAQKINLREFGSISNKTPFLHEGQLVLPHFDPDERGTRVQPNMRKLANDRMIRGTPLPFSSSVDDSIASTSVTDLERIYKKNLTRRRFEKNFKNFDSSRGNHVRSVLDISGFNPQYHRTTSENDQHYMTTRGNIPKAGVSMISNNSLIGRKKTSSHRFKNSNLNQMRHISTELDKIYKTRHRSLLDNIFGSSDQIKGSTSFIQKLFDITKHKQQNFLEQEYIGWHSKEYKNRSKPLDYAEIVSTLWNSLKSDNNTNFSGQSDKIHLKTSKLHEKNPFNKENVIIKLPEGILQELVSLSSTKKNPEQIRKIRNKIVHIINKKDSGINQPVTIDRHTNQNTKIRNKTFISLNGKSLSAYKYTTPILKFDRLSRNKVISTGKKSPLNSIVFGENLTRKLNKKSDHAHKYDTIYQDAIGYNPNDIIMNNSNLGAVRDIKPFNYIGDGIENFSSSMTLGVNRKIGSSMHRSLERQEKKQEHIYNESKLNDEINISGSKYSSLM